MEAGHLAALIARSADFYEPGAKTSVANILVFDEVAKAFNFEATSYGEKVRLTATAYR